MISRKAKEKRALPRLALQVGCLLIEAVLGWEGEKLGVLSLSRKLKATPEVAD